MWSGEKWKIVVARSTFPSQKVQTTSCADATVGRSAFPSQNAQNWRVPRIRMSKNSRRCGTKRISKSKNTKHTMLGPLFQVNNFTTQHAQESTNPSHPTFLLAGLKRLFLVLLAKLWCQHPWPTTYLPTHNRSNLSWVCENSPTPPATPKDSGSIKFCAARLQCGVSLRAWHSRLLRTALPFLGYYRLEWSLLSF